MATIDEVKALISRRVQNRTIIDGPLVRDSLEGNIDVADWNAIAGWLVGNDGDAFMVWLRTKVNAEIKQRADAEADTIYADQSLSHAEIERLFF